MEFCRYRKRDSQQTYYLPFFWSIFFVAKFLYKMKSPNDFSIRQSSPLLSVKEWDLMTEDLERFYRIRKHFFSFSGIF